MSSAHSRIRLTLPRVGMEVSVDFVLPTRGITVLFGASGSGKTSVLRGVAGLERACRGHVRICGEDWQNDDTGVFVPPWQRSLGYVFQEASLFEHLSVQDNLRYGLQRRPAAQGAQALDHAIDLLGVGHLLARAVQHLSGGERQRVAIARALAMQPKLLLLDEPLASLDAARRQDILPWLEKIRDELQTPMLYVSHAADEVARLADQLVVLAQGRIQAAGAAVDVLANVGNPVVVGEDVGALLSGHVLGLDAQWHLAEVGFSGGRFWVRNDGFVQGQAVRIRVLARDVSITTQEPRDTSIQNHVHATVQTMVADAHPAQALVQLRCGDALLLARVTQRAVSTLGLQVGQPVWAQVKSVALLK